MNFKQWQKKYPDALSLTLTSKSPVTADQAKSLLYGPEGQAKLLTFSRVKNNYTFIFSADAMADDLTQHEYENLTPTEQANYKEVEQIKHGEEWFDGFGGNGSTPRRTVYRFKEQWEVYNA